MKLHKGQEKFNRSVIELKSLIEDLKLKKSDDKIQRLTKKLS